MSNKLTWRDMVWSVARHRNARHQTLSPARIYEALAAKYPRLAAALRDSPSARSCVRAALSALRRDGLLMDPAQRARMSRSEKPWNVRNRARREAGLCVSCARPASPGTGRCLDHQRSHAEACAKLDRRRKMH